MQAVEKGGAVVGVKGDDAVVLAVERRDVPELQDPRTLRKVVTLDKHIALAFAGLNADARVLVDMARVEAQSHRLTLEDAPTVEYMARHIAKLQQQYTQRGGRRPFGLSTLLAGFDADGSPRLWSTDPSGIHTGWSANAIGRSYKSLREYLEAHYKAGLKQQEAVKLALSTLLEVVTASAAGVEVLVATAEGHSKLEGADLEALIKEIEAEKAEAEEGAAGAAASST
ncbi:PAD1 [Symbiodinium sp. KB8]|nr:PAD1 [Symbiodinium sp. KB8]